ncbi:HAD family hydrolase [Xenorhabdus szentirmaii]|uniref:phosphoglycolate phosphatase n=2 Tax=Xenorhabdus szentirmaii TaxID=290112 RepID=W1ISE1_9GAMM|nr:MULTISPECIES: HAD family hydrolase [Xenorhabdus]MBD2781416.1 HAD family hydrolase [Xenorhabdus sp. 38]MBD2800515.1 HAD family hydrolase [Xenorhabdus sp. M]MBD2805285.1 HAD family hydrolase [Xenorhabdus sp. ZM]MBD2821807.1 HAD family hydrolase [Xenorhabdus sp. 42]PHM32600.1 phosphatase [Xenorhabdus szentirmaii DSM 16338]
MTTAHIIWDWNGTLLNDVNVSVDATNLALAEIGIEPLTLEQYREYYCVPVQIFYKQVIGREPSSSEWSIIGKTFNSHYRPGIQKARLADGVNQLLARRHQAGATQSLCSLMEHKDLLPMIDNHGISEFFTHIDGRNTPLLTTGKSVQLADHIKKLNLPPEKSVVIGDATDDAVAALAAGTHVVLYTGGTHSRLSLEKIGVPVVDSLSEALAVADDLVCKK